MTSPAPASRLTTKAGELSLTAGGAGAGESLGEAISEALRDALCCLKDQRRRSASLPLSLEPEMWVKARTDLSDGESGSGSEDGGGESELHFDEEEQVVVGVREAKGSSAELEAPQNLSAPELCPP